MKYQPPFVYGDTPGAPGIHNANPDAPYVNGNPATGEEGSYVPAEAFEHPQREMCALIDSAGITQDHEEFDQVAEAVARYASLAISATCTNSANDYTLVPRDDTVVPRALFSGMRVITKSSASNTGAARANVFSLGFRKVLNGASLLVGNELLTGQRTEWEYDEAADGGAGAWIVMPWSIGSTSTPPLSVGTCSGAANTYTIATTSPFAPHAAFQNGMLLVTTPSATNTGASTVNAFALGSKAVRRWDDTALVGGELVSGKRVMLQYDSAANGAAGAWLIMPWSAERRHAMYTGGTKSIAYNTNTVLTQMTTVVKDTLGGYAAGVFTAPAAGLFFASLYTSFANGTAVKNAGCNIAGPDYNLADRDTASADSTSSHSSQVGGMFWLDAGETLTFEANQVNDSGTAKTLDQSYVQIISM